MCGNVVCVQTEQCDMHRSEVPHQLNGQMMQKMQVRVQLCHSLSGSVEC